MSGPKNIMTGTWIIGSQAGNRLALSGSIVLRTVSPGV